MVSESLLSLRWGSVHKPIRVASRHSLDAKNVVIPWGSPAGTLSPKRGWLWYPTSPRYRNVYVLICIFAHFLTQHVLKLWWSWTYQNSTVKRASVRVVPGWVTSWKVWFGRVKNGQYYVVGVNRYNAWRVCSKCARVWMTWETRVAARGPVAEARRGASPKVF
jgi:hypothetical protein